MTIEYRDGTFSKNMPLDDAMDELQKHFEYQQEGMLRHVDGKTGNKIPKALHIGTAEELDALKSNSFVGNGYQGLQRQIDDLRNKIAAMEKPESSLIHIPTQEEIRAILKNIKQPYTS